MHVVRDDASAEVPNALTAPWTLREQFQANAAACNQTKGSLYFSLKAVMPNLALLTLDLVHLPIVYEHAHDRTTTFGLC